MEGYFPIVATVTQVLEVHPHLRVITVLSLLLLVALLLVHVQVRACRREKRERQRADSFPGNKRGFVPFTHGNTEAWRVPLV